MHYIELKLKDLNTKSGIKLIQLHFSSLADIFIHYIRLGEIAFYYNPEKYKPENIETHLEELGFSPLKDLDDIIVEKIKVAAIELIYYANNTNSLIRNSNYISEKLQMTYDKLSRIFSKVTNKTLENYLISLKIEKAKELIFNDEHTLSEIAFMLGYSSVQYLSTQFKKQTGMTVSEFKNNTSQFRIALEDVL